MPYILPINHERLAHYFVTLCEIDSPGRGEGALARYLQDFFAVLPGVRCLVDDTAAVTGSDTGNLLVTIPGTAPGKEPLFFNCHMDVITPCQGVKVVRHNNVFSSLGETVLGSDDKAGIAILMELSQVFFENSIPHAPLEFLFTTGEEIGLLGAKAFNPALLQASMGFALDSTGVDNVIVGAPASVHIQAEIFGRASHAGLNPEDGINAISLAGQILSRLPVGRLDDSSTANIGLFRGGTATNIIPDYVSLEGEIRSHSDELLEHHIKTVRQVFATTMPASVNLPLPAYTLHFPEQYPALALGEDSPLLDLTRKAATALARDLSYVVAGGGSDANIFNGRGLDTAILGIGMENVHSTQERITLANMVRTLELVAAIATS
jgi:tripeptide aminopeptidase